jgi:diguanylate cyclase (GGDEF)-like protein
VVARRIETVVRRTDKVARVGGDEFVVLLDRLNSVSVARNIAAKLVDSLAQPFSVRGGVQVSIGASIGVVHTQYPPAQASELLRRADAAMYEAKKSGKSQYRIAFPA